MGRAGFLAVCLTVFVDMVGLTIVPAVGAAAAGAGFAATTWIAAALALGNLLFAALALPETRPSGASIRRRSPILLLAVGRSRAQAALLIGTLLGTLAFTSMESTLALLAVVSSV